MPTPTKQHRSYHPFYRWELLGLLCLAFFFNQGDRAIFGVVLPSIKSDLGLTDAQLGMVGSVLFLTLALLVPVAGYLGDIWSRKWIITCSLVFWSLATMITGAARGVFGLVAFRSVATAGGEAFYMPAACSLIASFHRKTRAFALSLHQCALYFGVITSGFLGGFIAERWGWRSTFYVFGSLGVFLGVVFCFRLKDAPRESGDGAGGTDGVDGVCGATGGESKNEQVKPIEALSVLFRTPTALLLTLGCAGVVFVNNAYLVWAPTFVQERYELSLTEAGGYSMLYHHITAMVGVLLGGRFSDAMVPSRPQFRLELQASAMLAGVPALLWMGFAGSLSAVWIAMAALGLCRGLYEANIQASLFDVIAPRYRASALAMMIMVAFLVGSASPVLLGAFSDMFENGNGLAYGFATFSLAYLLGAAAIFIALRTSFFRDLCTEMN